MFSVKYADLNFRLYSPNMNNAGLNSGKQCLCRGGTVVQAVSPTIYGLERPRGHRFESDPLSFPDSTPHLFSPSHFLSKPSLSYLIKGQKPQKQKKRKLLHLQTAFQANICRFMQKEASVHSTYSISQTFATFLT